LSNRKADQIRKNRAAITIQRYIRGWFVRRIKKNNILSNRLRENGLDDSIKLKENVKNNLAVVKKKAQVYRGKLNYDKLPLDLFYKKCMLSGIFKYNEKDTEKILQRLIVELTPRVAITLLPGLPAYIVFMGIR
jgi:myosin V